MKSTWSEVLEVSSIRDKKKIFTERERANKNFKSWTGGKENKLNIQTFIGKASAGEDNEFNWDETRSKLMDFVRKTLWLKGQDGDTSDEAHELTQFVCKAVGKTLKELDLTFDRVIQFLERLQDNPSYLFDVMSDAGNKFWAVMEEVKDWIRPRKTVNLPYCTAENGKEFMVGDYDNALEAERAKARYNRRISRLNTNFPDKDYKPMTQQEFNKLKRKIKSSHDGNLEKYLDSRVRSFHDLDEKWKISKRRDFKSFNDPIKREEKKDEFFVTGGSSDTEEPEDDLPF
jgi:hypothetical protein